LGFYSFFHFFELMQENIEVHKGKVLIKQEASALEEGS
jgi:hypothetical protein